MLGGWCGLASALMKKLKIKFKQGAPYDAQLAAE